jgi:hypothetical protein
MRYLVICFLALLITACTQVDVEYQKADGTIVTGHYVSTKSQQAPQFTFNKYDDTMTISAGAEATQGVSREEVAKLLQTVTQVLFPPPPPL